MPSILIVDDERGLLSSLVMAFETQGYRSVGAASAAITYWAPGHEARSTECPLAGQRAAVRHALDFLTGGDAPVLSDLSAIDAVRRALL